MSGVARRTHPWETAVPGIPPMFAMPWSAVCPGPPSNSWSAFERALSASAYGAPDCCGVSVTFSSTKKLPVGVGVVGFPTTALNVLIATPA